MRHYGGVGWMDSLFRVPPGRYATGVGEDSSAEASFVGGMRLGTFNATWPLVRLTLFTEGFRMDRSARLMPVPSWAARYDELTEVQAVGKIPLFSTGVRFRAGEAEWIVFWTPNRLAVMQAFASRGVAIKTDPIRFNYLRPGR